MAPVEKRLTMLDTGSTSSIGTGGRSETMSNRPRRVARRLVWSSTLRV